MSTTGHYPFSDIYAKIIYKQQENERTFEQIKLIWEFINYDIVIHKGVELEKTIRAFLLLNPKQLFQIISESEYYNTIDNIEVLDIDIMNDLIKSIENIPNQKDWRGITLNGYKEPKTPKYSIPQMRLINQFKTYLQNKLDEITKPKVKADKQPLDDLNQFFWLLDGYFTNVSLQPTGDFQVNKIFREYWSDKLIADVGHRAFLFVKSQLIENNNNKILINSVNAEIKKIDLLISKLESDKKLNNGFVIESNMSINSLFVEFKNDFYSLVQEPTSSKELVNDEVNKIKNSKNDADKTDNETSSNEVVKVEFKDFFINTKIDIIDNIQKEFKQASQTELAMLIIILIEYELVDIIANSKTKSRKHFIHSLIDNKRLRLTHIDNTIKKGIKDAKGNIINDRYSFVKVKLDKILCNVN